MAKNIEININNGTDYDVLYPKADYGNMNGNLAITNTIGNLPASRLSAGTLSGSFTFSTPPYCSTSPSSSYYLANKAYVDSKAGGTYVTYKTGSRTGNGAKNVTVNTGISHIIMFGHCRWGLSSPIPLSKVISNTYSYPSYIDWMDGFFYFSNPAYAYDDYITTPLCRNGGGSETSNNRITFFIKLYNGQASFYGNAYDGANEQSIYNQYNESSKTFYWFAIGY